MANPFVEDLIARHGRGDRSPSLLHQLDLLAWAGFHDRGEGPPGVVDTQEEAALPLLRADAPFANFGDEELLCMFEAEAMLLCAVGVELAFEDEMKFSGNQGKG